MVSILKVDIVKYECNCGTWVPLSQLLYCRACTGPRCLTCANEQIDSTFCPTCLENVTMSDARQRKNRCNTCNQCPMCGMMLVVRAANEMYHLQCNTCKWTTHDSGINDQPNTASWPEHSNPVESTLNEVLIQMKSLAAYEKNEKERPRHTKRRSNIGTLTNDKYGIHTMYNMRRKTMTDRPKSIEPLFESTPDVPELDPSIFTEPVDPGRIPTLDQIIKQPLCGNGSLLPVKVKLIGRRSIRCAESDHSLYKGEYSPASVKFKIQQLASDYIPDIKISREILLTPGQWSPLFLIVSNYFISPVQVKITTLNDDKDPSCIECEETDINVAIPNKDESADIDDAVSGIATEESEIGNVVFKKRHRVGIRTNVRTKLEKNHLNYVLLKMDYKSDGAALGNDNQTDKWYSVRVKVFVC